MSIGGPKIKLNGGAEIPAIGLGKFARYAVQTARAPR